VGSGLGGAFGWRVAFYSIGVPGIVAAMFVLRLQNPPVGVNDERGDVLDNSNGSSSSFEVVDCSLSHLHGHGKSPSESAASSLSTSETGVILKVLDLQGARDWRTRLWLEVRAALSDLWEIVCIKPFLFAVLGSAANSFGSGGLADWLPVHHHLIRTLLSHFNTFLS
jgi:hypothetical protein